MTTEYANPDERFAKSEKMVWVAMVSAIVLMLLALLIGALTGTVAEAMTVLVVGVPMLITAALAWSGITNWAEVRGIDAGYAPPPPVGQHITVNPPPQKDRTPVMVE